MQRTESHGSSSFVIPSPRGEGRFEIDPIAGALEEPLDLSKLREHVQGAIGCYGTLISKPFDCLEWEAQGVVCCAYTIVWRSGGSTTEPRRPRVQRQWHLSFASDMIVASYTNANGDEVAHDIFDCEEMVRSMQFERSRRP